jgi:hypothetical protein
MREDRIKGPLPDKARLRLPRGRGQMNEPMFWLVSAVAAILVVPPVVVSMNERRLRRHHRALAGRRKQKLRL